MLKITPYRCFLGLLFALCIGLAGRNDMLRDEQDMADFVDESRAGMVARAAEDQCGGHAIYSGGKYRCARDINQALVANAGETR